MDRTQKLKAIATQILIVIGIELLMWFLLPELTLFLTNYSWKSSQVQIDLLAEQGFSRKEAIGQLQSYRQSVIQAGAIAGAGANISAALATRR